MCVYKCCRFKYLTFSIEWSTLLLLYNLKFNESKRKIAQGHNSLKYINSHVVSLMEISKAILVLNCVLNVNRKECRETPNIEEIQTN